MTIDQINPTDPTESINIEIDENDIEKNVRCTVLKIEDNNTIHIIQGQIHSIYKSSNIYIIENEIKKDYDLAIEISNSTLMYNKKHGWAFGINGTFNKCIIQNFEFI